MKKESNKKKINYNQKNNQKKIRVERIEELMSDLGYKHRKDFAHDIDELPQNFSRDMKNERITEKKCKKIISVFPEYSINWLLGYSDTKYQEDAVRQYSNERAKEASSRFYILETALKEICALENIKVPTIDDIPEMLLLEAQLHDYAIALMNGYLHRNNSYLWNYLDNIPYNPKKCESEEIDNE